MAMEPYSTSEQVAEFFGVTTDTIRDWKATLGLPAHRFGSGKRGGILRFKMSEVQIWALRFKPQTRGTR